MSRNSQITFSGRFYADHTQARTFTVYGPNYHHANQVSTTFNKDGSRKFHSKSNWGGWIFGSSCTLESLTMKLRANTGGAHEYKWLITSMDHEQNVTVHWESDKIERISTTSSVDAFVLPLDLDIPKHHLVSLHVLRPPKYSKSGRFYLYVEAGTLGVRHD